MSKLSNVVKNDVVKKTVYNKLVAKVDNSDTSDFVLKTKYNTDKTELENKIPDTSGLVKKTNYNTKITELENKIPDISNLATKTALTAIENKIPKFSNLVKKTHYNTKITDIENKLNNHDHDIYIDTSKFNTFATNVFNTRLAQANLIPKTDFDAKLSSLNKKITKNKSKRLLIGEDGTQNYLVFQPMYRYFRLITNTSNILSWRSKGLSNENFDPPSTNFSPSIDYVGNKIGVKFNGSCLKQSNRISYTHGKIVNIYTVYEINQKDNTIISDPPFIHDTSNS